MPKVTKYPRGIRPRANGKWAIDVCVNGTRKTATADSLDEAVEKREVMTRELQGLGSTAPESLAATKKNWTLEYAIEKTFELVWDGTRSVKTNKENSKIILTFFGRKTRVKEINTDRIGEFAKWLMESRGVQGSTVNRKLNCLSRILRTAVEHDALPRIPTMHKKPERTFRIRFFTGAEEAEVLKWIGYLEKWDHHDATIILIDTGFRCSELWKLTAQDVNLDYEAGMGAATVWNPKNGVPRTVPLTTRVREILERRMEQHVSGPLFPGACKDWFHLVWQRVRALMNMENDPHFVPHVLRHTCCSRLVQRGFPLVHVQKWMGHLTIQTTMRYACLAPESLVAGVQLLEGGDRVRWSTGLAPQSKPV